MKTLLICAIIVSTYGYSIDFHPGLREVRSADQKDDLKSKLTKLQSLLKEIRLEEDILKASIGSKENDHMTENDQSKEPMTTKAGLDTGDAPNMKIKKFVESMTPRDIQTLREIRQMLATARDRRIKPEDRGEGENPGKFADDIVDSSDEGTNKYDWRDLARKLQSRRGDFNNNLKDEPLAEDPASVKTEEGAFGAFRDEIKESVEKNLLSDIALAIHSGISFEEIVRDLTEPDTPKGDGGWWKRG